LDTPGKLLPGNACASSPVVAKAIDRENEHLAQGTPVDAFAQLDKKFSVFRHKTLETVAYWVRIVYFKKMRIELFIDQHGLAMCRRTSGEMFVQEPRARIPAQIGQPLRVF